MIFGRLSKTPPYDNRRPHFWGGCRRWLEVFINYLGGCDAGGVADDTWSLNTSVAERNSMLQKQKPLANYCSREVDNSHIMVGDWSPMIDN